MENRLLREGTDRANLAGRIVQLARIDRVNPRSCGFITHFAGIGVALA